MPAVPVDIRCTLGGFSSDTEGRLYRAVVRGSIAMKVWLIGVMISLAAMALAVIVTDRAEIPKQSTQTVSGAVPGPGDTASHQENRGYKDFTWGDSVLKVKSRVPDLESQFSMDLEVPLMAAYIYQYWYLYETGSWIPNPGEEIEGKIDTFYSKRLSGNMSWQKSRFVE